VTSWLCAEEAIVGGEAGCQAGAEVTSWLCAEVPPLSVSGDTRGFLRRFSRSEDTTKKSTRQPPIMTATPPSEPPTIAPIGVSCASASMGVSGRGMVGGAIAVEPCMSGVMVSTVMGPAALLMPLSHSVALSAVAMSGATSCAAAAAAACVGAWMVMARCTLPAETAMATVCAASVVSGIADAPIRSLRAERVVSS